MRESWAKSEYEYVYELADDRYSGQPAAVKHRAGIKPRAAANQIPSIVESTAFNALNLYNKKREIDQANQVGYDNYAHRLAMCENAQNGPFDAAVSLGGGIIKEAYDLTKKIPQQGLIKPFQDSFKDMSNNIEGLQYGLTHPFNNCRTWLNNLDYENNKWKK